MSIAGPNDVAQKNRLTRVLLAGERRNVDRLAAERQFAQAAHESLPQCGRPDGGRQRTASAVQFSGAAHVDGTVQLQVGGFAGRPEVDGGAVNDHFAIAAAASHDQIVPGAIVNTSPGAAYFGRTRAEVHVNIDVSVEQFDSE